jgi:dihydropteroate synthase
MGILNITPDSFSDGGRFHKKTAALEQADLMISQGVNIIDVGGESSRPGANKVSAEEEMNRVIPIISEISRKHPGVLISIDTMKVDVARKAMAAGASMINDITGLRDPMMVNLISKLKAPVVIMHMQGTPQTMQKNPQYKDVVCDIKNYFVERVNFCKRRGINKIILDPGIGFGKTRNHNLEILRRLEEIVELRWPVLVGLSRKSFIGKTLGTMVDTRLNGTLAANAIAVSKGAKIIRVHDVVENLHVARMADIINKGMKYRKTQQLLEPNENNNNCNR